MEPEVSLPCSQDPATGTFSQPDESNPHSPILFSLRHVFILSARLGLPAGFISIDFPTERMYAIIPYVLHALHISSFLS
jgi:hypothetical protein